MGRLRDLKVELAEGSKSSMETPGILGRKKIPVFPLNIWVFLITGEQNLI